MMFGATLQAAVTILVATALATYVWLRAARTPLRGPLLGLLLALILWSSGVIWRFAARADSVAFLGMLITWAGVACVPPCWFLLASRYARVRALDRRPGLALVLFTPAAMSWISIATNPWHELFYRSFSAHGLQNRGPLYYAALAYGYSLVLAGIGLFLIAPRRTAGAAPRRDAMLVAVAALLPTALSLLYVARILPIPYDPTPGTFLLSLVVFIFGVFRYQLLDALPLARGDTVDYLREGIVIADPSGHVIDSNRAAVALLGRSASASRGMRLAEVLAPLGVDSETLAAAQTCFESLPADARAASIELRGHGDRRIEIAARCLSRPDGVVLGRLAVLRDRTDEHRSEALLRQSQKLETVGRLVAGVAHEVNNPLAFVRANLNHLERVSEELVKRIGAQAHGAQIQELVELPQIVAECLDGIDRIKRIVDAMRRFSRPHGEAFAPVDLNEVVRVALRIVELHRNERVVVEAQLSEDLPRVHGSATRLEQVLVNLLMNAKQALEGRETGRIAVVTRRAGDHVEIEVADDGPGILAEHRDRVFDPFFTTKGPEQGTGLGLSIAHDIVREHDAVLELLPSGASGARFRARFPLPPV
jgi:signal transduction histidine kinase